MAGSTTAFLFVGQGGEHVGMGDPIAAACPSCAALIDRVDQVLRIELRALMRVGPEALLHLTEHAQPALLAVSVAEGRHAIAAGERPMALLGHSLGQYSALVIADALAFDDALRLVHLRGRLMQEAVPVGVGAMAVILRMPRAQVAEVCGETRRGVVGVACHNAEDETVVSGELAAVEEIADRCDDLGATVMVLPASAPFHSTLLRPILPAFARALDDTPIGDAAVPVIDNVTGRPLTRAAELRRALLDQIVMPVRFDEGLRALAADGVRRWIGLGPGKSVLRLARLADPDAETIAASSLGPLRAWAHP